MVVGLGGGLGSGLDGGLSGWASWLLELALLVARDADGAERALGQANVVEKKIFFFPRSVQALNRLS